jgi:hypothetical protein
MRRVEIIVWICAVTGVAGAALGWIADPDAFASAWLAALDTWLLWPLGSLALLLAHSLTGGRWGEAARPGLLAGITTLPLLIPGLVPVLLLLPRLYHWARPEEIGHIRNAFWLNPTFFMVRIALYVAIWLGIAVVVLGLSRRGHNAGRFAPPALILLALSFTMASIDLTLSLEDFNSNIYGMLRASSAGLLALSIATLVAMPATGCEVMADLAKLLLALVVLWTYLDFMQLLIVWQSNLAIDSGWYVHRTTPYWGIVAIVLEVLRFPVPFLILVVPQWQRSRAAVVIVSLLLITTTIVRSWWLVLPAFDRGIGVLDIICMLAFIGLAGGAACRSAGRLQVKREALSHV